MAKFKVGDKVTDGNSVFQITKVNPDDYGWKLIKGDGKDVSGKSISAGGMISWADQKMRKAANSVTSTNPVVANAIKAANGSYDTLIIRKDPKFGNKWCIFQDGCSNRMVQRVFDTPEWAKKYIKEDLPAWKDAKIRVKNAVAKNAVDPLDALNSAETKMREAIGELGKVTDPDLRPLASRIATKLKAVQGELRRELAV